MAASPDGVIRAHDGNPVCALETKGLGFNDKDGDIHKLISKSKDKKSFPTALKNGQYELKTDHKFYAQVQGQMGVVGVSRCLFVACTGAEGESRIHFYVRLDRDYFTMLLEKVKLVNSYLEERDLLLPIGQKNK